MQLTFTTTETDGLFESVKFITIDVMRRFQDSRDFQASDLAFLVGLVPFLYRKNTDFLPFKFFLEENQGRVNVYRIIYEMVDVELDYIWFVKNVGDSIDEKFVTLKEEVKTAYGEEHEVYVQADRVLTAMGELVKRHRKG